MAGIASKSVARERILLYGGAKVGKSSAYLSIARRNPDVKFYVLDSDFAIDRMLEGGEYPNVIHRPANDWTEYVEGVREFTKLMGPNDWLIIDFISGAWDAVQAFYVEQVHGKDITSYFLDFRKRKAKGNELDGDTDWKVINKLYKSFVMMVLRAPGHVIGTATAKTVGVRDTAEQKSTFGVVGVRPEGQKKIAHDFHTIIFLSKDKLGKHIFTTVGDRERRLVEKQPLTDFATNYLIAIAGWRPTA